MSPYKHPQVKFFFLAVWPGSPSFTSWLLQTQSMEVSGKYGKHSCTSRHLLGGGVGTGRLKRAPRLGSPSHKCVQP